MSFTMTVEVSDETVENEIREKSTAIFESVFNASEWKNDKVKEIRLEKVSVVNGNEEPDVADGWIKAVYHVEKPEDRYIFGHTKRNVQWFNADVVDKLVVKNTNDEWIEIKPDLKISFDTAGDHTVYMKFKNKNYIPDCAFMGCNELKEVAIPKDVTVIGVKAFWKCKKLEKVHIPESVMQIGSGAFFECRKLKGITIPEGVAVIEESTFEGCTEIKEMVIPASVTEIRNCAFMKCRKLKKMEIPQTVKKTGQAIFFGCTELKEMHFLADVETLEDSMFENCSMMSKIVLADTITVIGYRAFQGCKWLEKITLPDNLVKISANAFSDCGWLSQITSLAMKAPQFEVNCMFYFRYDGTLRVPEGATGYNKWMENFGKKWKLEYIDPASK